MSPGLENNTRLPLDKYVLLKGGETKTPVPGKYLEMDELRLPAPESCHCAIARAHLAQLILMPECAATA